MRGDPLGVASTRFYSHIQHDIVLVYCLSCARKIYGEEVIDLKKCWLSLSSSLIKRSQCSTS
jgi:hypothetical protein